MAGHSLCDRPRFKSGGPSRAVAGVKRISQTAQTAALLPGPLPLPFYYCRADGRSDLVGATDIDAKTSLQKSSMTEAQWVPGDVSAKYVARTHDVKNVKKKK